MVDITNEITNITIVEEPILLQLDSSETTVVVNEETILVECSDDTVIVNFEVVDTVVVTVCEQGPPGIRGEIGPAGSASFTVLAGETLSGFRAVRLVDNKAFYCDGDNVDHCSHYVGITLNSATVDEFVNIQTLGKIFEASWNWTKDFLFVGTMGHLSIVPGKAFIHKIGSTVATDTIFLLHQPAILRNPHG